MCELAAASTDDELTQVVAATLGVVPRAQMSPTESIVDFLRPQRLLVVLDNCEHLLDAAARLAEAILAGAPGVRLLATSREGLAVPGEHLWPLRSLPVGTDDGGERSDAVLLFAERAQAVEPGFVLDGGTLAAVEEVCRRLDGIPLAIELAAARVAAMSPSEIAGHLDERFRLLTGSRHGRVERHQTLRAAVEWSYSLLDGRDREVFERLGVFPASFDEDAAVAVCTDERIERWDVIDALAGLVAKSMVGAERLGDTTRYQLLETLRHFARDQVTASGEQDRLRRRHAAHYAAFAHRVGTRLQGPDEVAARRRLYVEIDHLRAAAGWAFSTAGIEDYEIGVDILDGILIELGSQPSSEIETWAVAALSRVEVLPPAKRTVLLSIAANDAFNHGDFDQAEALGLQAIASSDELTVGTLLALSAVVFSAPSRGKPEQAMEVLTSCMDRFDVNGASDSLKAAANINAFWARFPSGNLGNAIPAARNAVAAARRAGSPSLIAIALAAYARAFADINDDGALAAADEAILLVRSGAGGNANTAASCTAALIRSARGDASGAARSIRGAVEHEARVGYRLALAIDLAVSALVLAGDPSTFDAAATVSGAVAGPALGHYPAFLGGNHEDRYHDALAHVASVLGPHHFAEAERTGAAMTLDEIVAYTLEHLAALADR